MREIPSSVFPKITMSEVKYPPGTLLRAKHNHNLRYVVQVVTSWHSYNCLIWTEEGLQLHFNPQYALSLEDSPTINMFCSEDHIDKDMEVINKYPEAPMLGGDNGS